MFFLGLLFADDREDFVLAKDEVLLVVDLDVGAGVLAEEDLVAGLDVQRTLVPLSRILRCRPR